MGDAKQAMMPLWRASRVHSRSLRPPFQSRIVSCGFATGSGNRIEVSVQNESNSTGLDPALVSSKKEERILMKAGFRPIGSRRRRAALQSSENIPFEQLPYQAFQEARKILQQDRQEKLQQIELERARIARLLEKPVPEEQENHRKVQLASMRKELERLKVLADINDPMVKKRFEDGQGDMNRPVYRYLANKKWRAYRRPLLMQRITQMHVIPDVLPHIDPIVDVKLCFGRRNIVPGEFVDSRLSESPGKLDIQIFERAEKLVTLAIVDADVPDFENDSFTSRCHFLASNIPISLVSQTIELGSLSPDENVVLPWLPPFAQKGGPYHRLAILILQQWEDKAIEINSLKSSFQRDGFTARGFCTKNRMNAIGVHLFRTQWDEGMAGVMQRAGMEGADIELRRQRVEPLPYKKRPGERFR